MPAAVAAVLAGALVFGVAGAAGQPTTPPAAAASPDEYSWLEGRDDPRALAWVRRQNERTLSGLRADPRFEGLHRDALALGAGESRRGRRALAVRRAGSRVHALFIDAEDPRGIWRSSPLDSYLAGAPVWRDTLRIEAAASMLGRPDLSAVPGLICAPGQTDRCLVAFGDGGGRSTIFMREFDMSTGTPVAGGFELPLFRSVVWLDDERLVAAHGGRNLGGALPSWGNVVELSRGQDLSQARIIYQAQESDFALDLSILNEAAGSARAVRIAARGGPDRGTREVRVYRDGRLSDPLVMPEGLTRFAGDRAFVLLRRDWTENGRTWRAGSIVGLPIGGPGGLMPELVAVPGEDEQFEAMTASDGALVVTGTFRIRGRAWIARRSRAGGWGRVEAELPDFGSVGLHPVMAAAEGGTGPIYLSFESFLAPAVTLELDAGTASVRPVDSSEPEFDAANLVVEQYRVASADGISVPYFLVRDRRAAGPVPLLIFAYGASGATWTPRYLGAAGRLWLERGGAYVLANIRGGGELGSRWHVQGRERLRTYQDIEAIARDLVARGLTTPRQLGFRGLSSGGLLGGVVATRHPELFGAALIEVPYLDLFRPDLLGYGQDFPREFGDPGDPADRAFMAATSPFQNIRTGTGDLEPFILTSTSDDTVHPALARRFAARMEALGLPFLFYETATGGHGLTDNPADTALVEALKYTYLWQRLGGSSQLPGSSQ